MDLESTVKGDLVEISIQSTRIDAASAIAFKDKVRAAAEGGPSRVLLNLSKVDFVDSSGLGAIVSAMKLLGADRKMELVGLTPKVEKVFRLTRMDKVFTIHATEEEALGAA